MDTLVLTTDKKRRIRGDAVSVGVIFAVVSAVAAFTLLRTAGAASFIATECLVAIALGWTVYRSAKNGDAVLRFNGDTLLIEYSDGRKYNVSDVDRSFFKLTQTKKEKAADIGSLLIESTNFRLRHIKDFSLLKEYISTHFEGKSKSIYYFDDDGDE